MTFAKFYAISLLVDIFFKVTTPLGHTIRSSKAYWQYITKIKHPSIAGKEDAVKGTLRHPDIICKSAIDETVYLYYRKIERLYCVVVKHISPKDGFLITAYLVDKIKEGETVWTK